ncbi:hypothetical protein UlMin_026739 [Ulmus minor]
MILISPMGPGEETIDVRNMTEHKRSPCSVDQSSFTSLSSKRQKPDLSISSKDKKENLGEYIVALQQLVSPYGNTDTASVLNEAMEYIQFLNEQVQLSVYGQTICGLCISYNGPVCFGIVQGLKQ